MNAIERAVVLGRGEFLDAVDFSISTALPSKASGAPESAPDLTGGSLEDLERQAILATLEQAGGNKSEAARRLGITRKTLHQKLKKYQ